MRIPRWILWPLVLLTLAALALYVYGRSVQNWLEENQPQMFAEPVYETDDFAIPDAVLSAGEQPVVLLFTKTNGFRHHEAIDAAKTLYAELAQQHGWVLVASESGAAFTDEFLARVAVVVAANASGPLFTGQQQRAFRRYLEAGGGYLALHAAGDGSHAGWPWYQDEVIRAHFTGHGQFPQFATATVTTEDPLHPVMAHLPPQWQHEDEWYCFTASPRPNTNVLTSIDEADINWWGIDHTDGVKLRNLAMGEDHPVIWHHHVGQGRVLYIAPGHQGKTYQLPHFRTLVEQATVWAGRL